MVLRDPRGRAAALGPRREARIRGGAREDKWRERREVEKEREGERGSDKVRGGIRQRPRWVPSTRLDN